MKYLIVMEKTENGYSAYSPDLDGCVAAGKSRQKVQKLMREAIALHLDGMREEGEKAPPPHTYPAFVDVPA